LVWAFALLSYLALFFSFLLLLHFPIHLDPGIVVIDSIHTVLMLFLHEACVGDGVHFSYNEVMSCINIQNVFGVGGN